MSPRNATEVGQRRHYTFKGRSFPSVTTLLKAWPMEWAIAYGAKHVAERAMTEEFYNRVGDVMMGSPEEADLLRWLKAAPHERRDAAADAGTDLHGYLELRLNGAAPAYEPTPMTDAIDDFVEGYRPEPLFVESQVFSLSEGYAGSADAFVSIYGKTYVLDLKTGMSAPTDHKARLQLAAYRFADFIGEDDREVAPVPMCDGALILSVPRDDPRSWQLIEVEAGSTEFHRFLDFKRAWEFYDSTKGQAVGELLLPQAEGDAA